ncbi:MAG: chloride channel protein [Pirellulales bacterium]
MSSSPEKPRRARKLLRLFPEIWEAQRARIRPQMRLLGLSLLVGIISGLGAAAFFLACEVATHYALGVTAGYDPSAPAGEPSLFAHLSKPLQPWLLILIPAVGGLVSGVIVFTFAPEAEGHGTDAAIAAYHEHGGYIRPRVPIIKLVASAITLGTGGSGGREGPIAQIGAGFGSFLAGTFRLRPAERRILMSAGMGAGIAAIFRSPLAGALFAAEVLYRSPDFESDVIIPATLASVTAYSTFGSIFGWEPLFNLPARVDLTLSFENPLELLPYLLLAVFMALLAAIYVRMFYGTTELFHRLPISAKLRPAIGAGLTGTIGVLLYFAFSRNEEVLSVMAFGYGVLEDAMVPKQGTEGSITAAVLLAVAFGKILTTSLTIGSGGSGGVFGPSMVIGGCGGGALGLFLHKYIPSLVPHPASYVIVGMAGFFAAAAKTPFSTLVMVSEMTGNYNLLLPTLWVCAIAFIISDERSIYINQVEKRSLSPAHRGDYVRDVLGHMHVRQFVTTHKVPLLSPGDKLVRAYQFLGEDHFHAIPVVDAKGDLAGVVDLEELHLASQAPHLGDLLVVSDLMRADINPLTPADRLDRALELFVESGLSCLPVVESATSKHVIGLVLREEVSKAYLRHVHGTITKSV